MWPAQQRSAAFTCDLCTNDECTPPAGAGAEDHFTQQGDRDCRGAFARFPGIDYWQGNTNSTARGGGPAFGRNGTYNAFQFNNEAVQIISAHDPAQSALFLCLFRATQKKNMPPCCRKNGIAAGCL